MGFKQWDVASTNIESIGYDDQSFTLTINFKAGKKKDGQRRTYEYKNISPLLLQRFLAAPSKGKFFRSWIRDQFPTIKKI